MPNQIAEICRWYDEKKRSSVTPVQPAVDSRPRFAASELRELSDVVQSIQPNERLDLCHFLLSFLGFAKSHGKPADDGSGWIAAADVKSVIRRWPGCQHMNYKYRMQLATAAGVFTMVKEKWQRPGGGGRARTYRLTIPITSPEEWTQSYEMALNGLVNAAAPEPTIQGERSENHAPDYPDNFVNERGSAGIGQPLDEHSNDTGPLHQRRTERTVGEASHQRDPKRTQAQELSDSHIGTCSIIPTGIAMVIPDQPQPTPLVRPGSLNVNPEPDRKANISEMNPPDVKGSMKSALARLRAAYLEAGLKSQGHFDSEPIIPAIPVQPPKDQTTRGP